MKTTKRQQLAKSLGVDESELDTLGRVTVRESGAKEDVNVQACLEELKNESN